MALSLQSALPSIQNDGVLVVQDSEVGNRLPKLDFHFTTPEGLEFIAQHSVDNQEIRSIITSILIRPYLAFVKVYSNQLPSDYAFFWHSVPSRQPWSLVVQLWSPGSTIVVYEGSHRLAIGNYIDREVSRRKGLLAVRKQHLESLGFSGKEVRMEQGGFSLADSRLGFGILEGFGIHIGFLSEELVEREGEKRPGKLRLEFSSELADKLEELEGRGLKVNYMWAK